MKQKLATIGLALLGLTATLVSRDASACGGTFCDVGPSSMPVDQTGENVLFVLDGNTVEAHVQIQYVGGAARFAWIVPMPKVPDVTVGSQSLFNALLQSTVPAYGFSRQSDQCGQFNSGTGGFGTGGSGGIVLGGTAGAAGGGPTVVVDKVVGSFEVVVLQGGTAQEVSDWLQSNGYQTVANAPALLQTYVDKHFVFAAIKLTAGSDVSEIHPLVFKYAGNEPCVPLQLTAVAAQEDMGVRTFFLGDDRVFPSNYAHVTLNQLRVDWANNGTNYKTAVSRAVDSPGADGHGFVTEYAGVSNVVSANGIYSAAWNAGAFRTAQAGEVVDLLNAQGLTNCYPYNVQYNFGCTFNQPLVLPLLEQFVPLPAGSDPSAYACLSCDTLGTNCDSCTQAVPFDTSKWDGNAFADALQARVIDPGQHALQLLQKWSYLTRLYTTISPHEMTLDPTFKAMPEHDYEFVNETALSGTLRTTCCGQQAMIIPAQQNVEARHEVALAGNATWPPFSSLMPWAERIEQAPLLGDLMTVVDDTQAAEMELARWNAAQGWPPPGTAGTGGVSGSCPTTGSSGYAAYPNMLPDDTLRPGGGQTVGCGCSLPAQHGGLGVAGALGLLGLGLLRRRRV